MAKDVFCCDCFYLYQGGYRECAYPDNLRKTWLSPAGDYYSSPEAINGANNCPWFEAVSPTNCREKLSDTMERLRGGRKS